MRLLAGKVNQRDARRTTARKMSRPQGIFSIGRDAHTKMARANENRPWDLCNDEFLSEAQWYSLCAMRLVDSGKSRSSANRD